MPTIEEALTASERQAVANGRSSSTICQVRRHVRRLVAWLKSEGRSLDVAQLDAGTVAEFMGSPDALNCSDGRRKLATSTNALRSSLRGFCSFIHEAGLTETNAARLLQPAVVGSPLPRALTEAQEQKLVAILDAGERWEERRDRMAFLLMLRCGLRLGSVVALNVEHCDLVEGILEVRLKRDRRECVHVPRVVREELVTFLEGRCTGALIVSTGGRAITGRQIQRRFARVAERAGLPAGTSCQSLRHTFATRLLSSTGNLELVRRAMCHRAASTTSIYLRVEDQELRAALGA